MGKRGGDSLLAQYRDFLAELLRLKYALSAGRLRAGRRLVGAALHRRRFPGRRHHRRALVRPEAARFAAPQRAAGDDAGIAGTEGKPQCHSARDTPARTISVSATGPFHWEPLKKCSLLGFAPKNHHMAVTIHITTIHRM